MKTLKDGEKYSVLRFDEYGFQVRDNRSGKIWIVNLNNCTCTCGLFQEMRFPCAHAAGAIGVAGFDFATYIHNSYKTENLRMIYSARIIPVSLEDLQATTTLQPPVITKKAGRPRVTRIRTRIKVQSYEQKM